MMMLSDVFDSEMSTFDCMLNISKTMWQAAGFMERNYCSIRVSRTGLISSRPPIKTAVQMLCSTRRFGRSSAVYPSTE